MRGWRPFGGANIVLLFVRWLPVSRGWVARRLALRAAVLFVAGGVKRLPRALRCQTQQLLFLVAEPLVCEPSPGLEGSADWSSRLLCVFLLVRLLVSYR